MSFKEKYGDRWDCLNLLLFKEQKRRLEMMANQEGVSMSAMARYILDWFWKLHKDDYLNGGEL